MELNQLYIGIGILVVITIGVLFSKNIRAIFSRNGLEIEKTEGKDAVQVKNVKNKSEVDINTKENQNIQIDSIDRSVIKINKQDNEGK